jgi:hypothetical protein
MPEIPGGHVSLQFSKSILSILGISRKLAVNPPPLRPPTTAEIQITGLSKEASFLPVPAVTTNRIWNPQTQISWLEVAKNPRNARNVRKIEIHGAVASG